MNKSDLIDVLAERFGSKRAAGEAVENILDAICKAVISGERVAISGFGVFERVERPARFARNPATGEKVKVAKTSVPKFKPSQSFKDYVSGSRKLPKSVTAKAAATTAKPAAKAAAKAVAKPAAKAATKAATKPAAKTTAKPAKAVKTMAKPMAKTTTAKASMSKSMAKPAGKPAAKSTKGAAKSGRKPAMAKK